MNSLSELLRKNREWADRVSAEDPGFFERLSRQQAPEFLWIGCSDSRVPANQIIDVSPGEVFVHRNIANLVVHTDLNALSVIQFAVEYLKVEHIIVCGHSDCGAMKAALDNKGLESLPKASRWLHHVEAAFGHRQPLNPADGQSAELASLIRGNVVAQLLNVYAQPSVARAVAEGRLTVHGWYYDILTGRIEEYDEKLRRFVLFGA